MNIGKYISLLLLLFFPQIINAQTAEQVIEKYIKAIGGQQALAGVQTLKFTREFRHTDSGRINRTTSFFRKPHCLRWETADQKRVWITIEQTQWRGKRDLAAGEFVWDKEKSVRRKPFILKPWGNFLDRERDLKFQYVGIKLIGSKKANHVVMISESGYRSELFFDNNTGLLIETRSGIKDSRFGLMISKISDYRPIGNVLFPYKEEATRQTSDKNFHQINTMIKVEINVSLKNALFQAPKKSNPEDKK